MFYKDHHRSFGRSDDRTVQHHRMFLATILVGIGETKSFRHHIIYLQSRQLPFSSQGIGRHQIHLGSVKCRLTWTLEIINLVSNHNLLGPFLHFIPNFGVPQILFRMFYVPGGKSVFIAKTESPHNFFCHLQSHINLFVHLIFSAKNMAIILRKGSRSSQSGQLARFLIPIKHRKICKSER